MTTYTIVRIAANCEEDQFNPTNYRWDKMPAIDAARKREIQEWMRENRSSFFKVNWRTLDVFFIDQDSAALFRLMFG